MCRFMPQHSKKRMDFFSFRILCCPFPSPVHSPCVNRVCVQTRLCMPTILKCTCIPLTDSRHAAMIDDLSFKSNCGILKVSYQASLGNATLCNYPQFSPSGTLLIILTVWLGNHVVDRYYLYCIPCSQHLSWAPNITILLWRVQGETY